MTPAIEAPSPNYDARRAPPDAIILHYTGMRSGAEALARLCDPVAKVSAHYLIEEDGRLYRLVAEERRAWHAGRSFWQGETDLNAASVGIELVNPGHEFGYRPFPEPQVSTLLSLLDDVRSRWTAPDTRILGHSDVAPDRKQDPGELFPWSRLAACGHGLWVEPAPSPGATLGEGDEGLGVLAFQAGLARLGYDSARTGRYDAENATITRAFQRHWRPACVDGRADGDTRARLVALLRAAQGS